MIGDIIQCKFCGEAYVAKSHNTIFCSSKCKTRYHDATREPRNNFSYFCTGCGIVITGRHKKKDKNVFCNPQCRLDYYKRLETIANCEVCGKEFNQLNSLNRYCSLACRRKHSVIYPPLKDFTCANCGIEFKRVDKQKGARIFCGVQCMRKYYNNRLYKSIPQNTVNMFLDSLHIKYTNEYPVRKYFIDNYLWEHNLAIEVMGDFWHYNPMIYQEIIYPESLKSIKHDRKRNYIITKEHGIKILYLWENDIMKTPNLCIGLIMYFLNKCGHLENYNSFNYHLNGNKIIENENTIRAYSEYSDEELSLVCNFAE